MNEQRFLRGAPADSGLMTAWLASGGALEMQVDVRAADSRRHGAGSDQGLAAGTPTTGGPECPGAWVNDGLQARRYTTYGDCVEDGLHAGGPSVYIMARYGCAGDI